MNKELYRFDVELLSEALSFIESLDLKTRGKVLENIRISRFKTDPKLLKKVDKEIWEFRTKYASKQIRLLAFWDKRKKALMICTSGFIKKSQKLPLKELNKAKRIRKSILNRN